MIGCHLCLARLRACFFCRVKQVKYALKTAAVDLMDVKDFSFELPDELIARYPQPERSASRLLVLDGATVT